MKKNRKHYVLVIAVCLMVCLLVSACGDDVKIERPPKPEKNEAYYLVDDYTMASELGGESSLASGWNYDNRYDRSINTTGKVLPETIDATTEGYAALNRDIEPQSWGVMTFRVTYTINSQDPDGLRFYFSDPQGNSVVEFIIKDGLYSAKSGDQEFTGTVKAESGVHTMKAEIDLNNMKGHYSVDGVKSVDFTLTDFSAISRINLATTVEDKISISYDRCHIYMNYAVNEDFFAPMYPTDWEESENAEVFTGYFDAYGTGTLKLDGNTTATKKFDSLSGKFVFESYVLVPYKADAAYINVGDVSVKLADSTISAGTVSKTHKNHIWQCIHIEGDTNAHTASLFVNGKVQGSIPMTADSISEISFRFEKNTEGGYMYVDDVEVYNIYDYEDYCPTPDPVNRDDEHTVIMSVCSLWREGTHYGWDYVSPYEECSPLLGYYDEGVPETADWETKLMVEHGVDALQYCWYSGTKNSWDQPLKTPSLAWSQHDGYFYSKYSDMIDFCFMWENAGFSNSKMNLQQFKTFLWDYWVEWYFTDPRYLCIDNKPVLHIYRMDQFETTFGGEKESKAVIDFMREDIKNYGFDDIIILFQTTDYSKENIEKLDKLGGDGLMAYAYGAESADPQFLIDKYDSGYKALGAAKSDMYIVPTVGTGRNILGWRNERTPVATVEQHASLLEYYKGYVQKQDIPGNMVYLSTWNEYGEGHWLAPSGLNAFGYANEWRKAYTDAPGVHIDSVPTGSAKDRICRLYNDNRTPIRAMLLEENEFPTVTLQEWDFSKDVNIRFWPRIRFQSVEVKDGVLTCVSTEQDPILRIPNVGIHAEDAVGIKITMRTNVSGTSNIYFQSEGDEQWYGAKGYSYQIVASKGGEFTQYYIDLTQNPLWKGNIASLRFDLIPGAGTAEVKKIEIVGKVADQAEVYVDGVKLNLPAYYIERTDDEFYVAGDPAYGIYTAGNFYHEWNRWTGKLFLKTGTDTEFTFTVDSDKVLVNGEEKTIAKPFYLYDGIPVLPMRFILDQAGIGYTAETSLNITIRDDDTKKILARRMPWQYEFDLDGDKEGWKLYHASATVENGDLVVTAQENHDSSGYDVQIYTDGMDLDTQRYSKVTIRLKPEYLPGKFDDTSKTNSVAVLYFATYGSSSFSEQKAVRVDLSKMPPDPDGYLTVAFDLSKNANWTGTVSGIRLDPTNQNGIYSIDYIRFSK